MGVIIIREPEEEDVNWGVDENSFFKLGIGIWAKIAGATFTFPLITESPINGDVSIRVRTGGAKENEFVKGYKLSIDGVNVPLELDTTKKSERKSDLFGSGGSYMGFIKGKISITDNKTHNLILTSPVYGAFDYIDIIEHPGITEDQVKLRVAAATKEITDKFAGSVTKEQATAMIDQAVALKERTFREVAILNHDNTTAKVIAELNAGMDRLVNLRQ